jgi:hypothetical protein
MLLKLSLNLSTHKLCGYKEEKKKIYQRKEEDEKNKYGYIIEKKIY